MIDQPNTTPHYTEGVCSDGAAILRDGVPMAIPDVLATLNEVERLRAALKNVASVEKQIRLMAYTSAGDPKLMDDMKMYAIWAGTLQAALAVTGDAP